MPRPLKDWPAPAIPHNTLTGPPGYPHVRHRRPAPLPVRRHRRARRVGPPDASWRAVLDRHPYPDDGRGLLGEALAATVLSPVPSSSRGTDRPGPGEGPLRTLVAQATHGGTIRGLARWEGEVPAGDLAEVFGHGRLVLTLEPEGGERYQRRSPPRRGRLAQALEGYFRASEQLGTRLWLAATPERAVGLLLQHLPGRGDAGDDWTRLVTLADTLSPAELIDLPTQTLLHRLFHEENLRLFQPEPVAFRCTCSRGRIEETLRAWGRTKWIPSWRIRGLSRSPANSATAPISGTAWTPRRCSPGTRPIPTHKASNQSRIFAMRPVFRFVLASNDLPIPPSPRLPQFPLNHPLHLAEAGYPFRRPAPTASA